MITRFVDAELVAAVQLLFAFVNIFLARFAPPFWGTTAFSTFTAPPVPAFHEADRSVPHAGAVIRSQAESMTTPAEEGSRRVHASLSAVMSAGAAFVFISLASLAGPSWLTVTFSLATFPGWRTFRRAEALITNTSSLIRRQVESRRTQARKTAG